MSLSVRRSMPGHPADGGDRRAAVGDADVGQLARGVQHVVEVHHRLAHPHEHEVVDGLDAAEVQHLVEDLARGQVAAELHRAGGAERARQRAARLRGHADRAAAVAVAHQHGLDRAAVVGVEQRLDRAVDAVGLVDQRRARRTGPSPPAARAARPAGRSSPRSRARRWPSSATPGGRGRRARRRRRACRREARGPPVLWWQARCASPSTSPTPGWPRAAPRRRSCSPGGVTVRGEVVRDPARDVDGSEGIEVDGKPASAWKGDRAVYAVNKPKGVVSTAADTHGRPTVVELVPERAAAVPGGAARRRHDRADPAHRRRAARAPAHASLVRGPAGLPRQGPPGAGARARAGGAARRRRARRRHDRSRPRSSGWRRTWSRSRSARAASGRCGGCSRRSGIRSPRWSAWRSARSA